jgi:outer membrane lipoprotein-sorting protein
MTPERRIPRTARWAVPAGAVALTGVVLAGYAISGAQAAPKLPARTPVQLLASVSAADQPPPMTAVVQESAALGLPDLPANGSNPLSALSWLTGSHTFKIWYADPAHVRVAVPVPLGESDLRRDGRQVWLWDSQNNQATHVVLPPGADRSPAGRQFTAQAGDGAAGVSTITQTPQQVARQLLAAVGPTTRVGLQQNVTVAGQAAYQISLAPKDSRSLIGQIRIAIAAKRALPLRVQVFARGGTGPAFQVGYTSLQFGTPSAANFAFTPPPGAKVKTVTVPSSPSGLSGLPHSPVPLQHMKTGTRIKLRLLPKGAPKMVAVPDRGPKTGKRLAPGAPLKGPATPAGTGLPVLSGPGLTTDAPKVLGKDWLSVVVVPGPVGPPPRIRPGTRLSLAGPRGPGLAVLGELLRAATPVHGSWGSGRLLTTALFSVLATNDGKILVGAVTPAVLYADAAQVK